MRRRERPVEAPCSPSLLSVACGSSRHACSSGTSPKIRPVTTATASVSSSTRPSSATASSRGTLGGARASNALNAATASATPRAAPVNVSTRFSIRNCRASATRSRRAPVAPPPHAPGRGRAISSRLATFTQPIEQHEADGAPQHQQRRPHRPEHHRVERLDEDAPAVVLLLGALEVADSRVSSACAHGRWRLAPGGRPAGSGVCCAAAPHVGLQRQPDVGRCAIAAVGVAA